MRPRADVAAAAALLAEPARAELVLALMDGTARPAAELAAHAGIAASTASGHLARLTERGWLTVSQRGRYRYYTIASAEVAAAVEALSLVAPPREIRTLREATRSELIRHARTCYDHLAGSVGVALTRALIERRAIVRGNGTLAAGQRFDDALRVFAIDGAQLERTRRPLVRGCLDWTERELHVAGAFGAAITARLLELGYLKRREATRSVAVTDAGERFLADTFGIRIDTGRVSQAASG
jgi:DNA-binding transcriptional ArsR family regulator